jgi:hypothetical protein
MTTQYLVKQATPTGEKTVFSSFKKQDAENYAKSCAGRVESAEVPVDQNVTRAFEEVTQ